MKREYAFLVIVGAVFIALTLVFLTFPRSTFSELERRELATFPKFSMARLTDGSFTRDVSAWFSDSQPFRDHFMGLSMELKSRQALRTGGDDEVAFHATAPEPESAAIEPAETLGGLVNPETEKRGSTIEVESAPVAEDGVAKLAHSGIIIVGSGEKVRALMAFGGSEKGGGAYAEMANEYKRVLGSGVNVYCMIIPTAAEFYTPPKAAKMTRPQLPTIRHIYSMLDGARGVDAYSALARHADESIYLRTDHHWSPLGAYYAAEEFARLAGVPFKDLTHYNTKTVRNFVGTMYGYSKDPAIKNAPEDFVYYIPQDTTYTVSYVTLTLNKDFKVVGESKPYRGHYFRYFKDGSSAAYSTFMGGDYNQTTVKTNVPNGRRLVVIKDSYGNAVPGYLFGSFEEIHVLDHRYFRHAVRDYVKEHGITDVLLINNIFNAYSSGVAHRYRHILTNVTEAPKPRAATAGESAGAKSAAKSVQKSDSTKAAVDKAAGKTTEKAEEKTVEKTEEKTTEKTEEKTEEQKKNDDTGKTVDPVTDPAESPV